MLDLGFSNVKSKSKWRVATVKALSIQNFKFDPLYKQKIIQNWL